MKSSGNETATESTKTLDAPSTETALAGTPPAGTATETSSIDTPSTDIPSASTPSKTAAGTANEPSTNKATVENTAQAATDTEVHKHTSVKPSILDRLGHFLEDVLKHVLGARDTSRIPNSAVPSIIDVLAKTDLAIFARLVTCAIINWVELNRATTRAILYYKQARL
jgi:hypothetical protein